MGTSNVAENIMSELATLTFRRTVDRALLHRSALSEVFLTDCRAVDADRYVAAAQLPPSHTYYTDHLCRRPLVDPMLLLECCRQAETYGGHAIFGVPWDTRFILRDWSLHTAGPSALVCPGGPAELAIAVTTTGGRWFSGALRGLNYEMDMVLGGLPAGHAHISVGYLPAESYDLVRIGRRGSAPPSSISVRPRPDGVPVPPHLVGRSNPENVLLLDPVLGADGLTAGIRTAVDNPSMFDHAQDHLPGMVLTEAARQACLFTLNDMHGLSPSPWVLTGMRASFAAYAELDAPTLVRVRPALPVPEVATAWELQAEFEQNGATIAEATLIMVQPDPVLATPAAARPASMSAGIGR